jgi:hypothetical protein
MVCNSVYGVNLYHEAMEWMIAICQALEPLIVK